MVADRTLYCQCTVTALSSHRLTDREKKRKRQPLALGCQLGVSHQQVAIRELE